jgi:hypothetical protein
LAHPQGLKLLKTNFKDEEDMVLELHRNLELFFPKKLKEIVTKIAQFD